MLRFFRRIRKGLLRDGATTRYFLYAIGEILLVMIGILLALQVNNWNEGRKDRAKEKDVLEDIMNNLSRNNEILRNSLLLLDQFDHSADIILSAIRDQKKYSDTLNFHFFQCTRTGGLLFPISSEGYESLKNAGFDIIQSESLKDEVLELFEVSYKRIKEKTQWTMDKAVHYDNYFEQLFITEKQDEFVPSNYEDLLKDRHYQGAVVTIKDNLRGWYKNDVIECLEMSEQLIQKIRDEIDGEHAE